MNRRQEREEAFLMLFESEFDKARSADEIYESAADARGVEDSPYVRQVLAGVMEHKEELDALIAKYSHGWRRERLSHVAGATLLLACYEMRYMDDIPFRVSINEALELMKKYDEDKARVFVNGVLNAVSHDEAVAKLDKEGEEA